MPPSKLIVTNVVSPKAGVFIRGVNYEGVDRTKNRHL